MNYWQYKFDTRKWHNWENIKIGEVEEWRSPKSINKKPNDIDVGDIVFVYRAGSGVSQKKKGIYFVAKVVSVDFNNDHPVNLEIIKDLQNNIFQPEYFGFTKIVQKINNLRQNGTYYKFLKSENPQKLYNLIMSDETQLLDDLEEIVSSKELSETEKKNLVKCRIGQGAFRQKIIDYWGSCAVTQYKNINVLIASHIKPWKSSTNYERLDVHNGFLLIPNLDKLFDAGYISFNDKGEIMLSTKLMNPEQLYVDKNMKVEIKNEHKKYLKFHRDSVFLGV